MQAGWLVGENRGAPPGTTHLPCTQAAHWKGRPCAAGDTSSSNSNIRPDISNILAAGKRPAPALW